MTQYKVGDKVVKTKLIYTIGSSSEWPVGTKGEVISVDGRGCNVKGPNTGDTRNCDMKYWELMTDFKVGDRVKIILNPGYISSSAQVGKEGVVKFINNRGTIEVTLENGAGLNFNSSNLEYIGTTSPSRSTTRTHRNDSRSTCYDCRAPTRIVDTGNPSSMMRVCTKCNK